MASLSISNIAHNSCSYQITGLGSSPISVPTSVVSKGTINAKFFTELQASSHSIV